MANIPDFAAQAERVNFLRDEAKNLLVRWKKGQNFFASFFAELEALRPQITDQLLGEWCFWNLGFGLNTIHKTAQILGEADADRVRGMTKIARDIEKAKAAAQRKTVAAEKRVTAEHRETLRAEKQAQREAAEAAKQAAEQQAELEAKRSLQTETPEQRAAFLARKKREKAVRKAKLSENPENSDLRRLLAEVARIEKPSRIELGRVYLEMKTIVENKQAGREEYGRFWTWSGWVKRYLTRSRQDVYKCIEEFVASCDKSGTDNIVAFR